jgi:hypothetical protein
MKRAFLLSVLLAWSANADAQTFSHRGFFEGNVSIFPEAVPHDPDRVIGDALFREEVFLKPAEWIQFAAGLDLRANSHDEVESEWRLDFDDRGIRRPRAAMRRLTATITAGRFSMDVGKQFIRWGRADILNPTDRFAPRDFLNVIDTEVLPVIGVRPAITLGQETFEAVWVPRLTPSRLPLFNQRWTVFPPNIPPGSIVSGNLDLPTKSQFGARWGHTGSRFECALSFFDGFNHLPNIELRPGASLLEVELTRRYPAIRTYGGDMAIPTGWITLKAEAAYFRSSSANVTDDYVLYVVEFERQVGEWTIVGGYAGEKVTQNTLSIPFAPDRGIARSILGRASYTVDPRRTVAVETAARQSGTGFYVKGEYSESIGQYVRLTVTGVGVAGEADDFLGQFERNSHGAVSFRFSF